MTLTEIGDRINRHLKRFEADPAINVRDPEYRMSRFYVANAARAGRYVQVTYVTYLGGTNLTRDEAERYLAWLDAGNVGRHYEALR